MRRANAPWYLRLRVGRDAKILINNRLINHAKMQVRRVLYTLENYSTFWREKRAMFYTLVDVDNVKV